MEYDLGFGNSVCVRKAFLDTYDGGMVVFTKTNLGRFDYPERTGDPELIELTRKVIKRQTGTDYKHILITNGATGGVVIALRMFAQGGYDTCYTRRAPWYLRYPSMIKAAGLDHKNEADAEFLGSSYCVKLLDIPSNPLGLVTEIKDIRRDFGTIIDAVYYGNVYSRFTIPLPKHDILVGSYSKLLGFNGLRVGWIATNDENMYHHLSDLVTGEYCGISVASSEIIKNILHNFDWDSFEINAQRMLDSNREEMARLERFMGTAVPETGMFYYGNTDKKFRRLMEKAGVTWTSGSQLGTNEEFGRLNMGQDIDVVWGAVEEILKTDTIR